MFAERDFGFLFFLYEIGLAHYLVVATIVFCAGVFVMATKRNAIGILLGVELVLNACNINLVAFARYGGGADGQVMALFVIALAAAEAAVAVAICTNFYKNLRTIDVDRGDAIRG